jgi:hypothetical protein
MACNLPPYLTIIPVYKVPLPLPRSPEISTGTLFASQLLPLNEPPQTTGSPTLRNGAAHEHFLSSVRALAEFRFLQLPGYAILGSWLVPPSLDDLYNDELRSLLPALHTPTPRRDIFRLSVNLGANGELYITPERNATVAIQPLITAQPPSEGTLVFLSPSGHAAEFISVLPSSPQTSSVLQKIRLGTTLEARFPLIRVRLVSGVETLWPMNLSFQRASTRKLAPPDSMDYFTFRDGVSSAVKLIADALVYKPPPAPSPAIPPSVVAHVTPSGVYNTPPDGVARSKPLAMAAQTPNVSHAIQEDWTAPIKEEDAWTAVGDTRADDEDFTFGGLEDGFDVREEDFNFFDDEPSGEFDAEDTEIPEISVPEEPPPMVSEEPTQPMEDIKVEKSASPTPVVEEQFVLSPPMSPLRILPSPPPTSRGSMPRVWDHVRLSGNLERVQDKYRRGGKYWCDDLDEDAVTDDSSSTSSSDDERMDVVANPRKRKREDEDDLSKHRLPNIPGVLILDNDVTSSMVRAIDENLLLLHGLRNDLFVPNPRSDEKVVDYANGLDHDGFNALVEIVASQVCWDGLGPNDHSSDRSNLAMDDITKVVSTIWGDDTMNNLGLKEWTEVTDNSPSFDEDDSPQTKTPRMKATKSPHAQNSISLMSNIEQTQSIYPIPSPAFLVHRIVHRNDPAPDHLQRLSVAPPALRFWDKLSMSPVAGVKDVRCYVVHPDSEGMKTAVDMFLAELQTTWESSGMGKFERGKVHEGGRDGMIPISVPRGADEEVCLAGYQDALVNFGMTTSFANLRTWTFYFAEYVVEEYYAVGG